MTERLKCWVTKRPSGKWRAVWHDPETGRQRSKHFDRKLDADRHLDTIRGEVALGTYIDPDGGRTSFKAYAEGWAKAQMHRPGTVRQVEAHLRNYLYPTFGERQLGSIKPSEVQGWVKRLSTTLAASTVELAYRWLSTIFRAAVEDGLIRQTPCRRISLPKKDASAHVVPLETAQVLALADAVPPDCRAMVLLAAGAGLRQGEVWGLTLDRVDFLRRQVRIDRQLQEGGLTAPKTAASVRTVPLPDIVLNALTQHAMQFPHEDFLFLDPKGRPWSRPRFGELWRPVCQAVGCDTTTFHDLRHYYASLLIRSGSSVKTIQNRLGHASAMVTLDTYGHLWPDSEDQTRTAVDAELGQDHLQDSEAAEVL